MRKRHLPHVQGSGPAAVLSSRVALADGPALFSPLLFPAAALSPPEVSTCRRLLWSSVSSTGLAVSQAEQRNDLGTLRSVQAGQNQSDCCLRDVWTDPMRVRLLGGRPLCPTMMGSSSLPLSDESPIVMTSLPLVSFAAFAGLRRSCSSSDDDEESSSMTHTSGSSSSSSIVMISVPNLTSSS